MMAMFEGGGSYTSIIYTDLSFTIRKEQHKDNINAILTAGIDALDVIKMKTPFSLKKHQHFLKAKKKLIKFKEMNKGNDVDIYNIVNFFYHEFEDIETNQFSGKQKDFIYGLNNLMMKLKMDLTLNYEDFVKQKFKPTGKSKKGYGGFYLE